MRSTNDPCEPEPSAVDYYSLLPRVFSCLALYGLCQNVAQAITFMDDHTYDAATGKMYEERPAAPNEVLIRSVLAAQAVSAGAQTASALAIEKLAGELRSSTAESAKCREAMASVVAEWHAQNELTRLRDERSSKGLTAVWNAIRVPLVMLLTGVAGWGVSQLSVEAQNPTTTATVSTTTSVQGPSSP